MRGEDETRGTFEWCWSAWNGDFRAADAETAHHRVIRSRCILAIWTKVMIARVLVQDHSIVRKMPQDLGLAGNTPYQPPDIRLNQGYAYSDLTQERSWACASDHNCRVSTRFCSGHEIVSEVKQRWQRHVVMAAFLEAGEY
jgi:hypothetical protein